MGARQGFAPCIWYEAVLTKRCTATCVYLFRHSLPSSNSPLTCHFPITYIIFNVQQIQNLLIFYTGLHVRGVAPRF
jgi:hypothetical protein